MYQSTTNFIPK